MAKNLLFDSISRRRNKRKGDGKQQRIMEDIITLLKETDPEEIPIFVAKDLQKLPPVTFDHIDVTRLLKDIIILQKELRTIQQKYESEIQYATTEELKQLRFEFEQFKKESHNVAAPRNNDFYINTKRGAYCMQDSVECESGPMGLLSGLDGSMNVVRPVTVSAHTPNNSSLSLSHADTAPAPAHEHVPLLQQPNAATLKATRSTTTAALEQTKDSTHMRISLGEHTLMQSALQTSVTDLPGGASIGSCARARLNPHDTQICMPSKPSYASVVGSGDEWEAETQEGKWELVQRKKVNNCFIGKKGKAPSKPDNRFKAADIKIPLFINNVDKNTSEDDIKDYIMGKTNISINLVKIKMRKERKYDAYKVMVPKQSLAIFMDDNLWPDGISFRRFIFLRKKEPFTESTPKADG